jgi:hypothetical protein
VTKDGNPDTSTGGTGTTNTAGKAAGKAADNNKPAGNTTTTPDKSGNPSASPSQPPKQGKNNADKAIDIAKQQKGQYTSPGNKRRSFRLEFRKDIY